MSGPNAVITLGLMGFGRIGRNLFRISLQNPHVRIGAISDIADAEALVYLLRYDTILGRLNQPARFENGCLVIGGSKVPIIAGRDPGDVPWGEHGVDYVVEATPHRRSRAQFARHLELGAKRVVICVQPTDTADAVIIHGVNHERLRPEHRVISNASCTAHCAAPLLATLHDAFGIQRAHFTTVHAYTGEQRLADVPAEDLRLSRSAPENIVPSESNAAHILEDALPALAGRLSSAALRVPVQNGSVVDLTFWSERPLSKDGINGAMKTAAEGRYRQTVEYLEDPIVSSDVTSSPYSATFDALSTMTLGDRQAKVLAWFDNSWGYCQRVVDLVRDLGAMDGLVPGGVR